MKNPRNPLVYIIDRNASYRRLISNCLSALGLTRIERFENVTQCLQHGKQPDIIILDEHQENNHPRGLDFIRIYYPRYSDSHFIFLSSNTRLEDAVSAMKLGACDYIVKSKFGLDRLMSRVDQLMRVSKKIQNRNRILRAAIFSFFIGSLLLAVAVFVYEQRPV